jgi:hypothetical protein
MGSREMDTSADARRSLRRGRPLQRGLAVVVVLLVVWVTVGILRAEAAARDYFAKSHPGDTAANVTVQWTPAIPPFWAVTIGGDVIEPGSPLPKYRSHMSFWIEPITGWVVSLGNG